MTVALGFAVSALAQRASAQSLVFGETWEGDAARWRAVDTSPINLLRDATTAVCSSRYQRETVPFMGGRLFVRAGVAVRGGERYCLTAWVRGSTGTQPFLGINLVDAAGTLDAEHWLIGRAPYATNYAGLTVVDVPADGAWHWLAAPFTFESTAQFVVIKDELFLAGAAGSADFDDIQLWQGACPATPQGAAHAACPASAPVCTSSGACVQCAADSDCGDASSGRVCDSTSSACVPGCREGGNGCPGGQRCVGATSGSVGRCEDAPDAASDVVTDAFDDATRDVVTDVSDDVARDSGVDASRDAGADSASDANLDAPDDARDASVDDAGDASVDGARDAGDAAADVTIDGASDVVVAPDSVSADASVSDVAASDSARGADASDALVMGGAQIDACGCRTVGGGARGGSLALLSVAIAMGARRRRRRSPRATAHSHVADRG